MRNGLIVSMLKPLPRSRLLYTDWNKAMFLALNRWGREFRNIRLILGLVIGSISAVKVICWSFCLEEVRRKPRARTLETPSCYGRNIRQRKRERSKEVTMAITREFRKTILQRAETDAEFRRHMLTEAVNELIGGDLNAGKSILRDYINATITFEGLASKLKKSGKSVHRMLGPHGNPRAENILEIIKILQAHERITLQVKAKARRAA